MTIHDIIAKTTEEFQKKFPESVRLFGDGNGYVLIKGKELYDYISIMITDAVWEILEEVRININCEIDCIQSGNALSPTDQQIALTVCENIKKRCLTALEQTKPLGEKE